MAGNQAILPEINARINKGFRIEEDGNWTCYRRNYISLTCSFTLRPWMGREPLFINFPDQPTRHISGFAMSISAMVDGQGGQSGETRELIQHTTKRDKQSETKPKKVRLQPSGQSSLTGFSAGPPPGNNNYTFGLAPQTTGLAMEYNTYATPQQSLPMAQVPTQHTFERIQFQKATANNGKRRAQQQHYRLVVELHAELGNDWIRIARQLSDPVVVRGRSPIHYKTGGGKGNSGGRGRGIGNNLNLNPDEAGGVTDGGGGGGASIFAAPPGMTSNAQLGSFIGYDNVLYTQI